MYYCGYIYILDKQATNYLERVTTPPHKGGLMTGNLTGTKKLQILESLDNPVVYMVMGPASNYTLWKKHIHTLPESATLCPGCLYNPNTTWSSGRNLLSLHYNTRKPTDLNISPFWTMT